MPYIILYLTLPYLTLPQLTLHITLPYALHTLPYLNLLYLTLAYLISTHLTHYLILHLMSYLLPYLTLPYLWREIGGNGTLMYNDGTQSDGMVEWFKKHSCNIIPRLSKNIKKTGTTTFCCSCLHIVRHFMKAFIIHQPRWFGHELRLPCDLEFGTPSEKLTPINEFVIERRNRLRRVYKIVRNRICLASDWMKTRHDILAKSFGIFSWRSCLVIQPSLQEKTLLQVAARLGLTLCDRKATERCHVSNSKTVADSKLYTWTGWHPGWNGNHNFNHGLNKDVQP